MFTKSFEISIHALREEGDGGSGTGHSLGDDFYPRPPRGGRRRDGVIRARRKLFLSTPSARRATFFQRFGLPGEIHFYPRPPRGGRPHAVGQIPILDGISIHALREEGDSRSSGMCWASSYFYPRPPRGGRLGDFLAEHPNVVFLSTPSARRATYADWEAAGSFEISIHALREEGDRVRQDESH